MAETSVPHEPTVGLLNLMPGAALAKTEAQWQQLGGNIVPIKFDQDPRTCGQSAAYVADCVPYSDVADRLDALVVTGANLELADPDYPAESALLRFRDIRYYAQLKEILHRTMAGNTKLFASCLASHLALSILLGDDHRERRDEKVFGVYDHPVSDRNHPLTMGLGSSIAAPHSRWGDVSPKRLRDGGVAVLAAHPDAGWLLAEHSETGTVLIQGHPEYGPRDLDAEYRRDAASGQSIPEGYYPGNNPDVQPMFRWEADRARLFQNLTRIVSSQTATLGLQK